MNEINFLISILGVIISSVGVIAAFKSINRKKPCWAIRSKDLIKWENISNIEKLSIKYENESINNLTVSRLIFWNNGNKAIEEKDMPNKACIQVKTNNETVKIIDVKIIDANTNLSDFKLYKDYENNRIIISFNFLNKNKGIVFEVLHTGVSSKDIKLEGELIDVEMIQKKMLINKNILLVDVSDKIERKINKSIKKVINSVLIISGMIFYSIGMITDLVYRNNKITIFDWTLLSICLVIIFISFWLLYKLWVRQVPKGLESFEDFII